MTFRSVLKTTLKISLGVFAFVGLCAVLWLAWVLYINLFDEPLTPEAEALLSYKAKALPDAENGYVMLAGFTAPAGSDWKKVGAERIARYNEQVRASRRGGDESEANVSAEEETQRLTFSECGGCEKILRLSSGNSETTLLASLQALLQQKEQIEKAFSDNAELISRYEALQSASDFSETALPSLEVSAKSDEKEVLMLSVIPIRRLLLHKVTLAALYDDREPLLNFLERDISLWRLVMKSDTGPSTAMFASELLISELRFLRALLAQIDFSASELNRLSYLLTPLSEKELSFLRTLEYEWNSIAKTFMIMEKNFYSRQNYHSSLIYLRKWLFQPRASINLFAKKTSHWRKVASLPSLELAAYRSVIRESQEEKEDVVGIFSFFQKPFNYLGRSEVMKVAEIGDRSYEKAIAMRHDIAAALQLIRAVLELRMARIYVEKNPEAVSEFLAQAGEETMNPYTGKPFEWNEGCRRLSFTPQNADYRVFYEVNLTEVSEENAVACAASTKSSRIAGHSNNSD